MTQKDISQLTFEEAISELETIIEKLGSEELSLDDSIVFYERGALLQNYCSGKLTSAEEKIDEIVKRFDNCEEKISLKKYEQT